MRFLPVALVLALLVLLPAGLAAQDDGNPLPTAEEVAAQRDPAEEVRYLREVAVPALEEELRTVNQETVADVTEATPEAVAAFGEEVQRLQQENLAIQARLTAVTGDTDLDQARRAALELEATIARRRWEKAQARLEAAEARQELAPLETDAGDENAKQRALVLLRARELLQARDLLQARHEAAGAAEAAPEDGPLQRLAHAIDREGTERSGEIVTQLEALETRLETRRQRIGSLTERLVRTLEAIQAARALGLLARSRQEALDASWTTLEEILDGFGALLERSDNDARRFAESLARGEAEIDRRRAALDVELEAYRGVESQVWRLLAEPLERWEVIAEDSLQVLRWSAEEAAASRDTCLAKIDEVVREQRALRPLVSRKVRHEDLRDQLDDVVQELRRTAIRVRVLPAHLPGLVASLTLGAILWMSIIALRYLAGGRLRDLVLLVFDKLASRGSSRRFDLLPLAEPVEKAALGLLDLLLAGTVFFFVRGTPILGLIFVIIFLIALRRFVVALFLIGFARPGQPDLGRRELPEPAWELLERTVSRLGTWLFLWVFVRGLTLDILHLRVFSRWLDNAFFVVLAVLVLPLAIRAEGVFRVALVLQNRGPAFLCRPPSNRWPRRRNLLHRLGRNTLGRLFLLLERAARAFLGGLLIFVRWSWNVWGTTHERSALGRLHNRVSWMKLRVQKDADMAPLTESERIHLREQLRGGRWLLQLVQRNKAFADICELCVGGTEGEIFLPPTTLEFSLGDVRSQVDGVDLGGPTMDGPPPVLGAGRVLLVGDRGNGRRVWLGALELYLGERGADVTSVRFDQRLTHPAALQGWLRQKLDVPPDADVVENLNERHPQIFLLDNLELVFLRTIGGFEALRELFEIVRSCIEHVWVLGIHEPAWRFLAGGPSTLFDAKVFQRIVEIHPLDSEELEVLTQQTRQMGYDVDFSRLRRSGHEEERETRHSFFRLLSEFSDGNAAVALDLWTHCLVRDADGPRGDVTEARPEELLVHLPADLNSGLPCPLQAIDLFLLTAIRLHDRLTESELTAVTHLPPAEVRLAVRSLMDHGLVKWHSLPAAGREGEMRIPTRWVPAITQNLRQHQLLH